MDDTYSYTGQELDIFAVAVNWKKYAAATVKPYIIGTVLEVGAGIGGTTAFFYNHKVTHWTCLEPDKHLANKIHFNDMNNSSVTIGKIDDIPDESFFDSILYLDVLEHIEKDYEELEKACNRLRPEGHIVIIAPAHQYLFSPFDKSIGHYRRYNFTSLSRIIPADQKIIKHGYLDSAGFFLSLANRTLLSQNMPSVQQISFWDKCIIPISRILDRLFMFKFGKSVFLVVKKVV